MSIRRIGSIGPCTEVRLDFSVPDDRSHLGGDNDVHHDVEDIVKITTEPDCARADSPRRNLGDEGTAPGSEGQVVDERNSWSRDGILVVM